MMNKHVFFALVTIVGVCVESAPQHRFRPINIAFGSVVEDVPMVLDNAASAPVIASEPVVVEEIVTKAPTLAEMDEALVLAPEKETIVTPEEQSMNEVWKVIVRNLVLRPDLMKWIASLTPEMLAKPAEPEVRQEEPVIEPVIEEVAAVREEMVVEELPIVETESIVEAEPILEEITTIPSVVEPEVIFEEAQKLEMMIEPEIATEPVLEAVIEDVQPEPVMVDEPAPEMVDELIEPIVEVLPEEVPVKQVIEPVVEKMIVTKEIVSKQVEQPILTPVPVNVIPVSRPESKQSFTKMKLDRFKSQNFKKGKAFHSLGSQDFFRGFRNPTFPSFSYSVRHIPANHFGGRFR